jgi:adenylate cyclase
MSIEAINEQLLRAIGVGVALIDLDGLRFKFTNDTFREWFGDTERGQHLGDLFPQFDLDLLKQEILRDGRYASETTFRMRRRTMTVAMAFNRALDGDERIAVLVCQNISRIKELESIIDSYSMMVERNTRELKREKEQVEKLLLNMMPRSVYEEYKTFGIVTPRLYAPVAAVCLDFIGFADLVSAHDPSVVVSELNDIYTAFDRIGEQFGCVRIRTVGDVYITMSGMPDPSEDFAESAGDAAIRFARYLEQRNASHPVQWKCRIGIAAGSVVGSVVGVQKYVYDVFGPAVVEASRLRYRASAMGAIANGAFAKGVEGKFAMRSLGRIGAGSESHEEIFSLEGDLKTERGVGR